MNRRFIFEQNLLALSAKDPALCSRLSAAETTRGRYKFLEARSGELVPAAVDPSGASHPLHSTVDPRREAQRLIATCGDEGFLIFLGLGGAFAAEAALEREEIRRVAAVEYDMDGLAELLSSREYLRVLGDPRFTLLADPSPGGLKRYVLENYQPVLDGGIRVFPLRARTAYDDRFGAAAGAIGEAIGGVSADYSVQAWFGGRWFSNIIRNLRAAEIQEGPLPPIREAAVAAAGPSLDLQIPALKKRKETEGKGLFLIAADTSLPALLHAGIGVDAVISIDCQHISYYHFMGLPANLPLFLDLASPPPVASRAAKPRFFSAGHPLTGYISRFWRPIPSLDSSGANVTCAALSLAESLGAEKIELYGADFSYPRGKTYARGTYIFPFFEGKQSRLAPLEGLFSSFLYRVPLEKKTPPEKPDNWYYETETLRRYRMKLEEKAAVMYPRLVPVESAGAPVTVTAAGKSGNRRLAIFSSGRPLMPAEVFLKRYRDGIQRLRPLGENLDAGIREMDEGERLILGTLLPQAAALKRRRPELNTPELIGTVRDVCVEEINRVLGVMFQE
ncbi:MAG: DUF115 domain-containing protein [Treponema sp.]|jgi:hypothetical protein|nr:DUF115 domain-containing protein [Treponema sp.]